MSKDTSLSIDDYVAHLERDQEHRRRILGPPQNTGIVVGYRTMYDNWVPRPRLQLDVETGHVEDGRCSLHGTEFMVLWKSTGRLHCRVCRNAYGRAFKTYKRRLAGIKPRIKKIKAPAKKRYKPCTHSEPCEIDPTRRYHCRAQRRKDERERRWRNGVQPRKNHTHPGPCDMRPNGTTGRMHCHQNRLEWQRERRKMIGR